MSSLTSRRCEAPEVGSIRSTGSPSHAMQEEEEEKRDLINDLKRCMLRTRA
jgi:hypothetical protein